MRFQTTPNLANLIFAETRSLPCLPLISPTDPDPALRRVWSMASEFPSHSQIPCSIGEVKRRCPRHAYVREQWWDLDQSGAEANTPEE